MSRPAITVLLPVHNGARFLGKAIDSVLNQTLSDFELLIINDGSTDNSEQIIFSYSDKRIRYVKNETNIGLIGTLNKGIDLAGGMYIARMDADDVCVSQRLQAQKDFLDHHAGVAFIASTVTLINDQDETTGTWSLDQQTTTAAAIKNTMVYKNCIAHPTIMGRTREFRRFHYKVYQQNIEDYDLWLRVLNSGGSIEKLPMPLLLYRQHTASVTNSYLSKNFMLLHYRMKGKFLKGEINEGRISFFMLRVFFAMLLDGVTALFKKLKRLF